jgi:hypothetical protein
MNLVKAGLALFLVIATVSGALGQETAPESLDQSPPGAPALSFAPENPQTGDRVKLNVTAGERMFWAEVRWTINNESAGYDRLGQGENAVTLDKRLRGGDVVEASVTPFTALNVPGESVSKKVIVQRQPPIMQLLEQRIGKNVYTAVVKARDPDGGPVTLSVAEGPPGMTISQDGRITWKFDQNTSGRFSVRVSAKNKEGAESLLSYGFALARSRGREYGFSEMP